MDFKKLFSSILLLIIGLLMANSFILWGDGCLGFPNTIQFIFWAGVYLIVLMVIGIIGLVKIMKGHKGFNYYPIITTVFVSLLVILALQDNPFKSGTRIYAIVDTEADRSNLSLRNNNTFSIQMSAIEWSCYYTGEYSFSGDTLRIQRQDIAVVTDSVFTNQYILFEAEKILKPLQNLSDTSKWLKITKRP